MDLGTVHYHPHSDRFTHDVSFIKDNKINILKRQVSDRLVEEFGEVDTCSVDYTRAGKKLTTTCPFSDCGFNGRMFNIRLTGKRHAWSEENALLEQSYRNRMFNFLTRLRPYPSYEPQLCAPCGVFVDRLKVHMMCTKHQILEEDVDKAMEESQAAYKTFKQMRDSFPRMKHLQ